VNAGSTERSLVLGAYSGLPARFVEPFAASLRATEFKGSFCIVAGRCEPQERARLEALADSVIDADPEYPDERRIARTLLARLRRTRGLRRVYAPTFKAVARGTSFRTWSSLEYHLEGLQALRYRHYHRIILEREPAPDFVLLTDLRDVVFQRDPFADRVDGLELFFEDASVRFGEDHFNTRWIRDVYGHAQLDRMRGNPVSCSGTVVGTRQAMLAYLAEMIGQIALQRGPIGSRDQAVHNVLIASGRLPSALLVRNGYGRVLTLGAMKTFELASDGKVLNADGSVPAVLHQWDRHRALAARVERPPAVSLAP